MKTIVFVLRGCPIGWLGAYGNEWVATPNLDRVAAEGVVFDRHISDQPDPAAATAAWLPRAPNVLESLRSASIPAVLVRANHPDTDGPDWFYAGWAEVFDARPQEADESPLNALIRSLPALLDRLSAGPDFLLWVETDRLLPPWDVRQDVFDAYIRGDEEEPEEPEAEEDEEYEEVEDHDQDAEDDRDQDQDEEEDQDQDQDQDEEEHETVPAPAAIPPWFDPPTGLFDNTDHDAWEWLHCSFAAVVTSLDAELGTIFDQLRAHGLHDSAAWLVTSDLGYPLGEHGQIGLHRPWLHEELVHLPLLLRLPAMAEAGRRVPGFTQPSDIAPTLLELFGLRPPEALSLLPLARGAVESGRAHAVTTLELNGAAEMAIRTNDRAFLLPVKVAEGETREPLLFEKPDDRWEVNDLRPRNIERADELEAQLKAAIAERE